MTKRLFLLPLIPLAVCTIILLGFSNPVKKKISDATPKGFAVVELFTSEGCSSCPPADEAVAELAKKYTSNVYVLGFHVDYWNYLGWTDEFSAADYSSRQEAYASGLSLSSTYTPQIIVNGTTEFTGSDKSRLYATVDKELTTGNNNTIIEMNAVAGPKDIVVSYKTNAAVKTALHIALVQLQASTTVKRGENKGKLLHHIDVVRNFKTVAGTTGSASISIPEGLAAKDCKIVAFVQSKTDLQITGAGECAIK